MKTIKQIANEIGVSKTAVRKKIANLGLQLNLRKNGNQFAIDEEQERLIKSAFLQNETQTENANLVCDKAESLQLVSDLVSTLQEQLREKVSENVVKRSYLRVEICGSKYNPNLLTKWSGRSCLTKWQGNVFSPATSAYTASIGSSVARLSGSRGRQPLPSESLRRTHSLRSKV